MQVEVTDADREAAAELWEQCFATTFYHEQTAGSPHIAAIFVDAFAACRQAAYVAGLERAAVIAGNHGGKTAYVLATAIRAEKDKT